MAKPDRAKAEEELVDQVESFAGDPLGFVLFAFPWGEVGSELEKQDGPDEWQREVLQAVRDGLPLGEAIRIAIAAGNGPGKTAVLAWLALWAVATMVDARGIITAITDTQLRTRTWAEVSLWFRRLICRQWFEITATSIYARDPDHERTWRIDAVPWSETNPQAIAGMHAAGKRIILLFDEASGIADPIFDAAEGAMTGAHNTEIIWVVAGNPAKATGAFRECFGRFAHRWKPWHVDTRRSRFADQTQIAKWIADYGEDSDYVRVHVKGEFPRAGSMQFIGAELVQEAMAREASSTIYDALVLGVDVARFGDDQSVIYIRKGRDGKTWPPMKFRGLDTMAFAAKVAEAAFRFRADAVFIDGGGVGGGVVDRVRQLRVPRIYEINFGSKPARALPGQDAVAYANRRAEMWGLMREWLPAGAVPDDAELRADLVGPEHSYVLRDGRDAILLESKEDMRRRGLASPDVGDALALTFALHVAPNQNSGYDGAGNRPAVTSEYDPFKETQGAGARSDFDPFADPNEQRLFRDVPIDHSGRS